MRAIAFLIAFQLLTLTAAADEKPLPPGAVRIGMPLNRAKPGRESRTFLTRDGATAISTTGSKSVEFWNPATGKRIQELKFGEANFLNADLAGDAELLALTGWYRPAETGRNESVLWLVNTKTRSIEWTLPLGPQNSPNYERIRLSADGKRLYGTTGNLLRVWDAADGEQLASYAPKAKGIDAFAVSPDGKTIAFGRYDLFLWKWESEEEPAKLASVGGFGTTQIDFSSDGQRLYVESGGRILNLEVPSGMQIGAWKAQNEVQAWALSPDGKTLAIAPRSMAGSEKGAVILHDPITGEERGRFETGFTDTWHLSWSGDGHRLAACSGYRIDIWDVATKQRLGPEQGGHDENITALAFAADGRLFTASDDFTIRTWDTAGKPGLKMVHKRYVRGMALSPDDSLVAGSALRNDLRIWDAKTGLEKFKLLGNGVLGGKRVVRFSNDSKRLVAWGDDHYLRAWDCRNGKLVSEHLVLPDRIQETDLDDIMKREDLVMRAVLAPTDISPDGSTMAIADQFINLKFIDIANGKERTRFQPSSERILGIAYSADGTRVAIAVNGPAGEIEMPDGSTRRLEASASSIGVWDVATQKPLWKAGAPTSFLAHLAFTPDGSKLAMSMTDSKTDPAIHLWDGATGAKLGRIELPVMGRALAFDRKGERLAIGLTDTTAIIFDIKSALKPEPQKK